MKPLRLTLSNFQSHRDTTLDLSAIACAVLSGPNGAGKSSLIDAIRFCLWGYARGGNLDTVITEGENVCRVEFEFMLGEEHYLVSRQRSKKGNGSTALSFQRLTAEGPIVLDGKTGKDTQQRIIDTLHMTDDLFCATACSSQGDASRFAKAAPADRKAVLGDILDLGAWERRADAARSMGRDLEATRGAKATALEQAEARAATRPELEGQLAGVADNLTAFAALLGVKEQLTADYGTEREGLIAARATDEVSRKALVETQGRLAEATSATDSARKRLDALTTTTSGRAAVCAALGAAERAGSEAAELEAKRQERERIASQGKELDAQIKAAKAEHQAAVDKLETEIVSAKRQAETKESALRTRLADLQKQSEPLESVPCRNTPMADGCPLIAGAVEAAALLPSLGREIEQAAQVTWGEDIKRLAELNGQTPAADLIAKRDKLAADYKAIEYDAAEHERMKLTASKVADRQTALTRIEEAEKQIPDAEHALDKALADLEDLETRVGNLTDQLGAPRDWAAELAAIDKQIADAKGEQTRLRSEIEAAQQRQGVLSEQLRQAEEAAEQVQTLRQEIAELDRRINLLKILGNPRDGAFSKGGIPALLIERAVPELEAAANEVLATLSNDQMVLALRTQKENSSKGLSETLDVVVSDERGERLYETFSGGEAMRVDLALRLGLSTLLAQRAGARCELLILDETCAPLDVQGQDQFVECVSRIADRFGTVLVISHVERLKDAFPVRLEVVKGAGGSSVEVIQ
jgi:exonuclease SbcC